MNPQRATGGINVWLAAAGVLNLIAAALHVLVVLNGKDWYLKFGGGRIGPISARLCN